MSEQEPIRFIAERPRIYDNDIAMPWPSREEFEELRTELYPDIRPESIENEENWEYQNGIYHLRDDYFRMRYRGGQWAYERFTGEELPEDKKEKLDKFLQYGFWAPAIDTALDLYEATDDDVYRQSAIFAGGLHIYDALNHSWGFLDPKLANDSGVREKHFLMFCKRIADVAKLPMDEAEKRYFEPLRQQFNLAYAEMAAQSPLSAARDLLIYDPLARQADEHFYIDKARASLIYFADADYETKVKVIERFKFGARESLAEPEGFNKPYMFMECLHLFGLATNSNFYKFDTDGRALYNFQWWNLTADEIMSGDTSRLYNFARQSAKPDESYKQDSLF